MGGSFGEIEKIFEKNIGKLREKEPDLVEKLARAVPNGRYAFKTARNGALVPAVLAEDGAERALHSLFDPQKEAARLIETAKDEGFFIFFGIGAGFAVQEALKRENVRLALIIDFDINAAAALFRAVDYAFLLDDPRALLLIDPHPSALERVILQRYQPVLMNGIKSFALRARVDADRGAFQSASAAVERAIAGVSADFSVQAHFGLRWFANIARNIRRAAPYRLPRIKRGAVIAAGPSLDQQMPLLKERKGKVFLIATDAALAPLLSNGIEPDAVVSIDCQHWTNYHFRRRIEKVPVFFDLASPPDAVDRCENPRFFAGGHPFSRYLSLCDPGFRLLELDTSGGNVTYTAVFLSEAMGAETTELFGADFSYPSGAVYARGVWLYPFNRARETRLRPAETAFSELLYRAPLQKQRKTADQWYYETPALAQYRARLENAAPALKTRLIPQAGQGAAINLPASPRPRGQTPPERDAGVLFAENPALAESLLDRYRLKIKNLPLPPPLSASNEDRALFATLLPTAAALKYRAPALSGPGLLETARSFTLNF